MKAPSQGPNSSITAISVHNTLIAFEVILARTEALNITYAVDMQFIALTPCPIASNNNMQMSYA